MRAMTVVTLSVMAFACGKSEGPDAGAIDSGAAVDAGFDAGHLAPVCLPDQEDAGNGSDAGLDFSCRGHAPAPGGQAELVVSGKTTRAGFTRTALPGIQLDLLSLDGTVLASTLSGDGGLYRLRYDAGCEPVQGEVRATNPAPNDAGFYVSYSVPDGPWTHDRSGLELVLFDASTRGLAAAIANVTLVDGTAVLALTVVDCAGNPVEGATLSLAGDAGAVRYVGPAGLPSSVLTATGPTGDAVLFNLPGTSVEVSATLDGGLVGQRVVPVHADAASGTFLSP